MTLEAPTEHTKFISSQQMVSSETYERVISLGEALVEELKLNPGVDTLSRWMAHYVAEKIELAKTADGDEKAAAQQACFDTILKLWEHRSHYQHDLRPFQNFEAIFKVIERLDPDSDTTYFHRSDSSKVDEGVQEWLDLAMQIDRVARLWLSHVLQRASEEVTTDKVQHWLTLSADMPPTKDRELIDLIAKVFDREKDGANSEETRRRLWLQARLEELDAMTIIHEEIREALSAELKGLDTLPNEMSEIVIDNLPDSGGAQPPMNGE